MQQYKFSDLDKLRKEYGDDLVDKVTIAALNKTAPKLQTFISKEVRQRYNIKASDIKRQAKRFKAWRGSNNAFKTSVLFRGSKIGLTNFGAKPKRVTLGRKTKRGKPWGRFRTGVSVRVLKTDTRKQIKSKPAFLARGLGGNEQVFYRDQRGRRSSSGNVVLHSMKGPSIPDMVIASEGGFSEPYDEFSAAEFDTEFDRAMGYYLSKM